MIHKNLAIFTLWVVQGPKKLCQGASAGSVGPRCSRRVSHCVRRGCRAAGACASPRGAPAARSAPFSGGAARWKL